MAVYQADRHRGLALLMRPYKDSVYIQIAPPKNNNKEPP